MEKPVSGKAACRFRNLSLFWKHLLMMLCVLLLCLCALLFSNHRSIERMKAETLEKLQLTLDRNCGLLSQEMLSARMIPDVMEESGSYTYIRNVSNDSVDKKFVPVLHHLQKVLSRQVNVRGASSDCVVFFANIQSCITPSYTIPYADDLFPGFLRLSQTEEEAILSALNTPGTLMLLPMQRLDYRFADKARNAMALIIRDKFSRTGVITFYSEDYILEMLGLPYLPEGTGLRITAADGTVLADYPGSFDPETDAHSVLSCELDGLSAEVAVFVPDQAFSDQLRPVRQNGMVSVLLVSLIGILMSLLFSQASVAPIRGLLHRHGSQPSGPRTNEITQLDRLLIGAQQTAERVTKQLTQQILTRALTGGVLSEHDEHKLNKAFPVLSSGYRVAILHASPEINGLLEDHLRQHLDDVTFALISRRDTGMLLPADESHLQQLTRVIGELNGMAGKEGILCGVSAPAADFGSIHKAVRQARAALPGEHGVKLFPGGLIDSRPISWLQHERLYQSIFACNEEQAIRILDSIAAMTDQINAREVYYNIRFVLRSAAEEMELPSPAHSDADYTLDLLPQENIHALKIALEDLFRSLREKNERSSGERNLSILQHIQASLSDYNLCAASAAEQFGISERRMYDIVRKETGMSFNEYVTSLRMKQAEILLCTTDLSISEIGLRCGYRTSGTFHRLFKDSFGMSPGQLRSSGNHRRS